MKNTLGIAAEWGHLWLINQPLNRAFDTATAGHSPANRPPVESEQFRVRDGRPNWRTITAGTVSTVADLL